MTYQQDSTTKVLENMIKMVKEDQDYVWIFSDMLEHGLNSLAEDDCFGTEQSTDPRGDFRNGDWSMGNIEEETK